MRQLAVIFVTICIWAAAGLAQDERPMNELDVWEGTAGSMQFEEPTRITGRVLTQDTYDDALWIQWTRVYEEGRWLLVLGGRQLLLYPRDGEMWEFLRRLPPGTEVHLTVQTGQDGKRRVLKLQET